MIRRPPSSTLFPYTPLSRSQIQFSAAVGNVHYVTADSEALRQGLTNLFDNALRYTPPGGRITVSLEPARSGEHTSELQSQSKIVCRLLLVKTKRQRTTADT